jgi:alpha-tubulin suppressor-like RCC1 family protein
MATLVYPYVQYSGIWNISSQANAKAAGTWPVAPISYYLYGWGANDQGYIGDGTRTNRSSPVQIGSLTWGSVARGFYATAAVRSNGTLWTWGQPGSAGTLGHGNTNYYSSPKQVGSLTNWSSVSIGESHMLSVKTDGTAWSWGQNNNGQLGLGNTTDYNSPKQIGALTNWRSISCGFPQLSFAIKTDGTLWAWGNNSYGGLGLNTSTASFSSPQQVGSLTNWLRIVGGRYRALAVKTDGTMWSWGYGPGGVLGLGNSTYYSSPKQIGALTTWSSIGSGSGSNYGVKTDGTLWAWGYNFLGSLGNGNTTDYSSPIQVGSLTNWLSVAGSAYSASAIKTNKTLWAWGPNSVGQLGLGNTTTYSSPKQVGLLTSWALIAGAVRSNYPGFIATAS